MVPVAFTAAEAMGATVSSSGSPAVRVWPISSNSGSAPSSLRVTATAVVTPWYVTHSTLTSSPDRYSSTRTTVLSPPWSWTPRVAKA